MSIKPVLFAAIVLLCSCTPSRRAFTALQGGDVCGFCQISAENIKSDPASLNNVGICYQNGWCGYERNVDEAKRMYRMAANQDVPEAKANLTKLETGTSADIITGITITRSKS